MSIFISYSRKDQAYVNKLVEALRKQELPWWLDNKIDYGDQWTREIKENIKKCQVFLLVMSPNSEESDWVQRELTFAQHLKKPIFPLLLDGEIWFQVINIQIIDVKGGKLPPDIFFNKVRSKLNNKTSELTAEDWFNLGVDKYDLGDYQGAIADYNQAIKIKPDFALAYINRGLAKSNLGDKQGAIADYNQAIRINANWGNIGLYTAYSNRGSAKSDLGDNQGAITDYNQAIQIKPDYATAYYNRGKTKSNLGDYQGAIADYNQAIKIKPDFADAYYNRGAAKDDLGDYQGAIADYNQAIQIKPDDADAYYGRGKAKSNLGDNQGAITDYNQAIQIKPDYADAYCGRGIAKSNLGDNQGAIADFNQAAQLFSQQSNMEWYRKALNNIKNLEKPPEKGFWGNVVFMKIED